MCFGAYLYILMFVNDFKMHLCFGINLYLWRYQCTWCPSVLLAFIWILYAHRCLILICVLAPSCIFDEDPCFWYISVLFTSICILAVHRWFWYACILLCVCLSAAFIPFNVCGQHNNICDHRVTCNCEECIHVQFWHTTTWSRSHMSATQAPTNDHWPTVANSYLVNEVKC